MSEIPDAEFRAFLEFLRLNPDARRSLAYRMIAEEAIASAQMATPLNCPHGYYTADGDCPYCEEKGMEG